MRAEVTAAADVDIREQKPGSIIEEQAAPQYASARSTLRRRGGKIDARVRALPTLIYREIGLRFAPGGKNSQRDKAADICFVLRHLLRWDRL